MQDKEKFTFFLGGPFSNFYPAFFTDKEGITYSCSEQFYMAKKALFFKDNYYFDKIINEKNPKLQKKYGRSVRNFDESVWYGYTSDENPAKKYMSEGNFLKYSQNEKLRELLLKTEGTTLVEASPYDSIWGIGMRSDQFGATIRRFWKGKNWMGEILTEIRDTFIKENNFLF